MGTPLTSHCACRTSSIEQPTMPGLLFVQTKSITRHITCQWWGDVHDWGILRERIQHDLELYFEGPGSFDGPSWASVGHRLLSFWCILCQGCVGTIRTGTAKTRKVAAGVAWLPWLPWLHSIGMRHDMTLLLAFFAAQAFLVVNASRTAVICHGRF